MADKDFLSQFSDTSKPDSFKEEERIPIKKERKPVNVGLLVGLLLGLLVLGVLAYFLFLAPKIEMPNFVGKNKSDVAAWVKQQGIESSGIVFDESYDFDSEEGTILSQSIAAGKKVKNNVKLNFSLSLGPDPDEKIKVPDIASMSKSELQNWISNNKLTKTKVVTAYSDTVEEDQVIDYSFTGCDEDSFNRSCTLKINVSKGKAPAGKVTVEDFEKKSYESVEAWAKSKKVNLTKEERYSDSVDSGYVISQSIAANKTMNEGDTLHVIVSLGKAVSMPDMYEWKLDEIKNWCRKNGIILDEVEYDYDDESAGECIDQSVQANAIIKEGEYLSVIISKGDPDINEFNGTTLDDLKEWVKNINKESGRLKLNVTYRLHDSIELDHIIELPSKVKTGSTINVVISDGKNVLLKPYHSEEFDRDLSWSELVENPNSYTEDMIRALCEHQDYEIACEIVYDKDVNLENAVVLKATRSDEKTLADHVYLPQRESIIVVINDKGE